ncbi:serine/threonine-protein kinase [Dactylosporangium sp. NPDC049742]|uniref:serine/threonine-protein kinase n=1 Tax=Dactylosporangium sp. NPDC049742 TaxID=3154737 RepID=UPI003422B352
MPHSGLGEIWGARDRLLNRRVIIKVINPAKMSIDLVRRFRREAQLTARLDHPGVPAVFDLGDHEGRPYLVLQRVNGITLADLTAEQDSVPIAWICAIGAQISSVLIAAQQIDLVHRDLKPSNVMLEPSGAVKVLDFGLALVHDDGRYSRITRTGESVGTVGYMAPEQIRNESTDHRTDLYGLGATLFHLLTGQPPFDDETTTTIARRQLYDPPPRPGGLRPDTPKVLDELVHALLAEHPQDRPDSAADVYNLLAPLSSPLPPMPGFINDDIDAVRSYAAIVGRLPAQHTSTPAARTKRPGLDPDQADAEAERLHAAGQFRPAARLWRQLADQLAAQHGERHPMVFDCRVRAARAHVPLGEHDRALRLLDTLLQQRIRLDGAEHRAVTDLRQEIARLRADYPTTG